MQPSPPSLDKIRIRSTLAPGDMGMLIHLHGRLYAQECGYNLQFEGYVCKTFYDLMQNYSPAKDRFWFVEDDGQMVGAIAIVGHTGQVAQLRWFILLPAYRGLGLGRRLMDEALQYCRDQGYKTVFLYTTADQKTAVSMYLKAGFKKIDEAGSHDWGKHLVEEKYELNLEQTSF